MSEQWDKQFRLQRLIERTLENYKKVGRGNLTASRIRSRISSFKEIWVQYQEGHDVLSRIVLPEDRKKHDYFVNMHFEATKETYQQTLDTMSEQLKIFEPYITPNQSHDHSQVFQNSSVPLTHLPPIDLPPFNGKRNEWENLRNRFTSLIIENKDLSNFSRMHFLKSCLKDCALECVNSISVTSENFTVAWNALKSRYENKRRLLNVHLSALLNLNPIPRESESDLESLRDKVNSAVASLYNLDRTPE